MNSVPIIWSSKLQMSTAESTSWKGFEEILKSVVEVHWVGGVMAELGFPMLEPT